MSGNNAGRQGDEQGKKVPSSLKRVVVLIVLILCVWGYTRWSGKNAEIGDNIDAALSDKPGEVLSAGKNSADGVTDTLSSDISGNDIESQGGQLSMSSGGMGHPDTLGDSLIRPETENKTVPLPPNFSLPGMTSSSAPGDALPTESAKAPPKNPSPQRMAGRTPVLPPSAAPGHIPARVPESIPPAILDVGGSLAPVKEDGMILPAFIKDLARLMAQSYYPAGSHPNAKKYGISVLTLKKLNMRYGLGFYGFNVSPNDPKIARRAIFTYIMNSDMLDALYGLYADTLTSELSQEADSLTRDVRGHKRGLTPAEKAEMFILYARDARALSAALVASGDPEVSKALALYHNALRATTQANSVYVDATVEYEAAKLDGKNVNAALTRKEQAGVAYQHVLQKQNSAREKVLLLARKSTRGVILSDDTLLYALSWGQRRLQSGSNSRECLYTMARILDNLAARFDKRAKGFH